jgi:hypothetical protein
MYKGQVEELVTANESEMKSNEWLKLSLQETSSQLNELQEASHKKEHELTCRIVELQRETREAFRRLPSPQNPRSSQFIMAQNEVHEHNQDMLQFKRELQDAKRLSNQYRCKLDQLVVMTQGQLSKLSIAPDPQVTDPVTLLEQFISAINQKALVSTRDRLPKEPLQGSVSDASEVESLKKQVCAILMKHVVMIVMYS